MDKTFKDKSSPSPDFNSPNKSSQSEEVPELVQLEKLFQRNKSPKSSPKAPWEDTMPTNKEDKISQILKDSRSQYLEEDFQSCLEPNKTKNDSLLYLKFYF